MMYTCQSTSSTLQCHWCGISLSFASNVKYLNGSLPICDLCLQRSGKPVLIYEPKTKVIGYIQTINT
jgi:hypothetical protein